jgi:glycosyltransferase involved in cell wall biosynthesis
MHRRCCVSTDRAPTVVLVLHRADVSGPARTLASRFERMGPAAVRHLVVPREGTALEFFANTHNVHVLAYEQAAMPASVFGALRLAGRWVTRVNALRRLFRSVEADIVITATTAIPFAAVAARLASARSVVYCGELFKDVHAQGGGRRLAGKARGRLHERAADVIVCCSDLVAGQFRAAAHARVSRVYPGIPAEMEAGQVGRLREVLPVLGSGPVVLAVGNLVEGRGQDVAIEAFALLRRHFDDASLLIVGSPADNAADIAYASALRRLVEDRVLQRHVHFLPFTPRIEDAYALADVTVNLCRMEEPFGRVAFESLRARTPVVASAVGAIPELLTHEVNGLLVAPDDPAAAAAAVLRLLTDVGLRDRLVAQGYALATSLAEERGMREFINAIHGVRG